MTGYEIGDRVLVGAITPCGQCHACLSGKLSQCGHGTGYEAIGGWRFGNTINGAQAEYLLVPYAQANLAKIPECADRRTGRPAGRHRVDWLLRRRVRQGPNRRHGRGLRAGPDRALRHRRREAHGRVAGHRRRGRPGTRRDGASHGRRRRARSERDGHRRRGQAPDERHRRRRGDRGPRAPGDVRERIALRPAGRDRVEPRRVLREAAGPLRGVRGWSRRPHDRHDPLPGRQGADAATHAHGRVGPIRSRRRSSPIGSRSTRSSRPTTCSATGATAC